MLLEPLQCTLADGVKLSEVTFVVVDLETTGGSPTDHAITEVGAVTYRGGERLSTFQTLVDPRQPIPPYVAHLTGIDDLTVAGSPEIHHVLPSFLEFARGAIFVGHNASFDLGFLNANLLRLDYEPLEGPPICTARLARRVVWPDVPNVRLATLARYFRTRSTPVHRALADAEATAEVLNGLIELGGRLGISTLGDLREACTARGRPNFGKIRLADPLPRSPGVYLFEDRSGKVLYVGKAVDLRARVRSYFYGDERKKVQNLLDAVQRVQGIPTEQGEAEALVLEARLIARHEPPFNSHGKRWRRYAYLKIDPTEAWPRVKVVRTAPADDGCTYLGPFGSSARARASQGCDRGRLPDPSMHDVDGRADALRAVRPRRHGAVPRAVRWPHYLRAVRGARRFADGVPRRTGGPAGETRGKDARPRCARAVRGGGARP